MIVADRADGVESPQVVTIGRMVAMPGDHIERRVTDACRPQVASEFRHELEADIEPFRGLLLALFFMGVGMSIDLTVVRANLGLIALATVAIAALKIVAVWAIFLPTCGSHREALRAGAVLTAADEFAFVLIPLGVAVGALSAVQGNLFAAIAAATMLIATPVASLVDAALRRLGGREAREVFEKLDEARAARVNGRSA